MPWIDHDGFTLRYELTGQGAPTLVLIHEMGGMLETWDEVVELLGSTRRTLRFDLRGSGLSQKIQGVASFGAMVADVGEMIRRFAPGERIVLCGCAVGAAVALGFAAIFPDQVAGLILMSPAAGIPPERRAETLAAADRIERNGLSESVDQRLERTFPTILRSNDDRLSAFRARMLANDPVSYAAQYRMLSNLDLVKSMAAISCPALVLAGTLDQARPPATVEKVARAIPGATFKILETGHVMPALTPELISAEIHSFVIGLPPAAYLPR